MKQEETRSEQFPVRMTPTTRELLEKLATKERRSMNDIVTLAIEDYAVKCKVMFPRKGVYG